MTWTFTSQERFWLWLVALAGLLGPNGVFLYHALFRTDAFTAALQNPVALVFMVDAMVAMALLALQGEGQSLGLVRRAVAYRRASLQHSGVSAALQGQAGQRPSPFRPVLLGEVGMKDKDNKSFTTLKQIWFAVGILLFGLKGVSVERPPLTKRSQPPRNSPQEAPTGRTLSPRGDERVSLEAHREGDETHKKPTS